MVYFFHSNVVEEHANIEIFMGKDKFENEDLIRHAWKNDIWFHVDKVSSAHVYLRIPEDAIFTFDCIPEALLADCAQLVKQNSIEGCKKSNVTIIYTPASNLKKTGEMDVGTVSFHRDSLVKRVYVEKKDAVILGRLEKTRTERLNVDFAAEKATHEKQERFREKAKQKKMECDARQKKETEKRAQEVRSYSDVLKSTRMESNLQQAQKYSSAQEMEDSFFM